MASTNRVGRRVGATVSLALAGVILGIGGCDQKPEQTAVEAPPPAVTITTVKPKDITTADEFSGRIEAVDSVDLRARVPGFLEKRLFEEGGDVKKDQLCFVIEKAPYQATVAAASADVQEADARAAETRATAARFEQSVKSGAVSRLQYDEAIARRDVSAAEVLQKQAALDRAELDLSYTDVLCPVAGRISRATYSVGNYVTPESGVLAKVVSQDPMYVTFPISQRYVLEYQKEAQKEGSPTRDALTLKILLGDGSTYSHDAKIDFAGVQISESTDTLTIRGVVPNPERLLIDGQFVTVSVESAKPESMLVVPQQALQADQAGLFVLVVGDGDKVEVKRVEIGPSEKGETAVTEGLKDGEKVIIEGIQKVRPGQAVAPSEAPAAKPDA